MNTRKPTISPVLETLNASGLNAAEDITGTEEFSSIEADQARMLTHVSARIHAKVDDYTRYQFSFAQTQCFNIFFDLAQELDEFEELCALTVMLPEVMFNVPTELFLLDPSGAILVRQTPGYGPVSAPPIKEDLLAGIQAEGGLLRMPIHGKRMRRLPVSFGPTGDYLGMLVFHVARELPEHERLFYQKFANRVGFQMHNRLLVMKNQDHLRFINNLVHDIGHNVIVPNMYFKLLFHQLEGKIHGLAGVREKLEQVTEESGPGLSDAVEQLGALEKLLEDQYAEIYKYFLQSSLFLETLLRQSHFEKGHYVLQKTRVNLVDRVLVPQMERYRSQLEDRGISPSLAYAEQMEVPADVGLISQVVANFISNAVKYTRPSPVNGEKVMICSCSLVKDAFAANREGGKARTGDSKIDSLKTDGLRVEVLSSGPHIDPQEAPRLFKPDFRGSNTQGEYGTGHGLYFTSEIITRHGGLYGYEAVPRGNAFYFILPLNDVPPPDGDD